MKWLLILLSYCICNAVMAQEFTYRYWFDTNVSETVTGNLGRNTTALEIDASQLSTGIHAIYYQVIDTNGVALPLKKSYFEKISTFNAPKAIVLIDGEQQESVSYTIIGDNKHLLEADADTLPLGLHSVTTHLMDDNRFLVAIRESYFMRVPTDGEYANMQLYYSIDGDTINKHHCTTDGHTFHADVDMASLQDGLHTISFMLGGTAKVNTQMCSAFFFKEPLGGNGIVAYQYWVNDDNTQVQTGTFDTPQSHVTLTQLVDLPHYPLRSSSFSFYIKDGAPMICPRNRFNLSILDAAGRYMTQVREYDDITIQKQIDTLRIKELERGTETNIGRIKADSIMWCKLYAESGDSLSLSANAACTMDLFSPSGEKVWSKNGVNATNRSGLYAREDGIFYLALHDAQNPTKSITVDYQHIDKYAVIEYTPAESPLGVDLFMMDVDGNGFDHLKEISLHDSNGMEIVADTIYKASNTSLTCIFNLSRVQPADNVADINFYFEEDSVVYVLTRANGFKFVDRVEGEITTKLIPSYKTTVPYDVTISIKNTGNVSYWGIPLNLAMHTTPDGVMYFKNFVVDGDNDDNDSRQYWSDNLLGTGEQGFLIPMILPYIGPNEEVELTYGIDAPAHSIVGTYVWAGEPWSEEFKRLSDPDNCIAELLKPQPENYISATTLFHNYALSFDPEFDEWLQEQGNSQHRAETVSNKCNGNNPQPFRDVYNLAENASNVAEATGLTIGGIHNSLRLHNISAYEEMIPGLMDDPTFSSLQDYKNDLKKNIPSPMRVILTTFGYGDFGEMMDNYQRNCANCSNPMPARRNIEALRPGDPNDILGYTAESGSEYIGLHVTNLPYCIEFENDPQLANAAAHKIVLRDVLDPTLFDLTTFKGECLTFGNIEIDLNGVNSYIETVDLRPAVNAVAQVSLDVDDATGLVECVIEALDPMTLEPTYDQMQGILPVNTYGEGIGTLTFNIALKKDVTHNTEVDNFAEIFFDEELPITTPTWHNITDYSRPKSTIENIAIVSDSQIELTISCTDSGSGVWYYDLYCQQGEDSDWVKIISNSTDSHVIMDVQKSINYGFCVIATDMAGNTEDKTLEREYSYSDGEITTSLINQPKIDNGTLLNGRIYDLSGRPVIGNPHSGVYIVNGKKFSSSNIIFRK